MIVRYKLIHSYKRIKIHSITTYRKFQYLYKFQSCPLYLTIRIYIQIHIEFDPITIGDRMVSTRLAIKYTFERRDYTDEP